MSWRPSLAGLHPRREARQVEHLLWLNLSVPPASPRDRSRRRCSGGRCPRCSRIRRHSSRAASHILSLVRSTRRASPPTTCNRCSGTSRSASLRWRPASAAFRTSSIAAAPTPSPAPCRCHVVQRVWPFRVGCLTDMVLDAVQVDGEQPAPVDNRPRDLVAHPLTEPRFRARQHADCRGVADTFPDQPLDGLLPHWRARCRTSAACCCRQPQRILRIERIFVVTHRTGLQE
jgi:hypothetical protein